MTNQLVRRNNDRILGGVASGIAQTYGWKTNTVRLAMLASCLLPGPQIVAYVIAWAVIPDETSVPGTLVS